MFLRVCVRVRSLPSGQGAASLVGGTEIKDRVEEVKRSGRGEPISVDQKGLLHPPDPCCVKEAHCAVTR